MFDNAIARSTFRVLTCLALLAVTACGKVPETGTKLKAPKGLVIAGAVEIEAKRWVAKGDLVSNNGGSVISDAGGSLVSIVRVPMAGKGAFKLAAAPAQVLPEGLCRVAGMTVRAIDQRTGEQLGESVKTDGKGRYRLTLPGKLDGNVRVEASFPRAEGGEEVYETLLPPRAQDAALTSDSTRAATRYIMGILPMRLNSILQARLNGEPTMPFVNYYPVEDVRTALGKYDDALSTVGTSGLGRLATNGFVGRFAARVVGLAHLDEAFYQRYYEDLEQIRKQGEKTVPLDETPLLERVQELHNTQRQAEIPALLTEFGMPEDEANELAADMVLGAGMKIKLDLANTAVAHEEELREVIGHEARN